MRLATGNEYSSSFPQFHRNTRMVRLISYRVSFLLPGMCACLSNTSMCSVNVMANKIGKPTKSTNQTLDDCRHEGGSLICHVYLNCTSTVSMVSHGTRSGHHWDPKFLQEKFCQTKINKPRNEVVLFEFEQTSCSANCLCCPAMDC
jgi:hypothetical protein